MLKRDSYLQTFKLLGEDLSEVDTHLQVIEEFVCKLYGLKKVIGVNDARFEMFRAKLSKSGIVDLSVMPPCRSVLNLHLLRSAYIASIWKQATTAVSVLADLEEFGWFADGEIEWTDDIYPLAMHSIFQDDTDYIVEDGDSDEDSDDDEEEEEEED